MAFAPIDGAGRVVAHDGIEVVGYQWQAHLVDKALHIFLVVASAEVFWRDEYWQEVEVHEMLVLVGGEYAVA